jgi:hypothetical protein
LSRPALGQSAAMAHVVHAGLLRRHVVWPCRRSNWLGRCIPTIVADALRQQPADSIHRTYAEARETLDALRVAGVDHDDVMRGLEAEGMAKFDAAWDQAGEHLTRALRAHAAEEHGS